MNYKELTVGDCELLALTKVQPIYRQREADLFQRKWFDYRHLHPVQATYLFAECYQEAMKKAYIENKDKASAEDAIAFKGDIFTGVQAHELTSIWRARQMLDALGLRYEFALRYAVRRFSDIGWRIFPRPNQLYGEEFLLDARDAWHIECEASLQIPLHERFQMAHFIGHSDQLAYQAWLIEQIKKRPVQYTALARAINAGVFSKELALRHFTSSVCKKAFERIV